MSHEKYLEESYVDILEKLSHDIDEDKIPFDDRLRIVHHIDKLKELLWKYSN